MSTFTDGAPPSVSPGPEDGPGEGPGEDTDDDPAPAEGPDPGVALAPRGDPAPDRGEGLGGGPARPPRRRRDARHGRLRAASPRPAHEPAHRRTRHGASRRPVATAGPPTATGPPPHRPRRDAPGQASSGPGAAAGADPDLSGASGGAAALPAGPTARPSRPNRRCTGRRRRSPRRWRPRRSPAARPRPRSRCLGPWYPRRLPRPPTWRCPVRAAPVRTRTAPPPSRSPSALPAIARGRRPGRVARRGAR